MLHLLINDAKHELTVNAKQIVTQNENNKVYAGGINKLWVRCSIISGAVQNQNFHENLIMVVISQLLFPKNDITML